MGPKNTSPATKQFKGFNFNLSGSFSSIRNQLYLARRGATPEEVLLQQTQSRSHEQGRGFAVVASEVRSLAQRSANAAKEIAKLIGASVEDLKKGSAQVSQAGATMTEIVAAARAVDEIMLEIASASAQQSKEIEHVRLAVEEIDQTSQQQAALTRATLSAQDMLRSSTTELRLAVAAFRLKSSPSHADEAVLHPVRRAYPVQNLHGQGLRALKT